MTKEKITVCPYCDSKVGEHFEIHEVLIHPEKRERFWPEEYKAWKAEQDKALAKKKRKKDS
jgi:hypothetical protein